MLDREIMAYRKAAATAQEALGEAQQQQAQIPQAQSVMRNTEKFFLILKLNFYCALFNFRWGILWALLNQLGHHHQRL